jgi:hypothetical protein
VNQILKFTLIAAALGGLVYLLKTGKDQVTEWADKITVKFASIGKPGLRNGNVTIPITLSIFNPSPLSIPLTNISGKIFLLRNSLWQPVGDILPSGAVAFAPGETRQTFFPVIDLSKFILITSVASAIQAATSLLNTGGQVNAKIKIDVTVNVKGFEFTQSAEQSINLNDLYRAAA